MLSHVLNTIAPPPPMPVVTSRMPVNRQERRIAFAQHRGKGMTSFFMDNPTKKYNKKRK